MPQIRKALLTVLVLAAVLAALSVHPGTSSASPRLSGHEPVTPTVAPPPPAPLPPGTHGEPDEGSTLRQQIKPSTTRFNPADRTQFAISALRMLRWSSLVWMRHAIGVGE